MAITFGTPFFGASNFAQDVFATGDLGSGTHRALLVFAFFDNTITPGGGNVDSCVIDPAGANVTMTAGVQRQGIGTLGIGGSIRAFWLAGATVPTGSRQIRVRANQGDGKPRIWCLPVFGAGALTIGTEVRAESGTPTSTPSITVASVIGELVVAFFAAVDFADSSTFEQGSPAAMVRRVLTIDSGGLSGAMVSEAGAASVVVDSINTGPSPLWGITAWSIAEAASGDVTPPTLTGVITPGVITSSSIGYSHPAGADNVGVSNYQISTNGGSSWTDIGLSLSGTLTGLASSTPFAIRIRSVDAAGNVSTPPIEPTGGTISTTAPSGDATAPVMTGSITPSGLTPTSVVLSWPAATDNVGVTGYERSLDAGTNYINIGLVLTSTPSDRIPGSTDNVRIRAYDAAGNRSAPLSLAVIYTSTSVTTQIISNGSGTPLANTLLSYSFVRGRIGSMGVLPVLEGNITSSAGGTATVPNLPNQLGMLWLGFRATSGNSNATTDKVYYEAVTPT